MRPPGHTSCAGRTLRTGSRIAAVAGFVVLAGAPGSIVSAAPSLTWGPETNLSATSTDSETGLNHRPLALTPDGTLHVVWAERDSPNDQYRIHTRRRTPSGSWSAPELVVDYLATDPGDPGDNIGAKFPALAAAPDGTLHLFWHDYRVAGIANVEIYTKCRPAGGTWDASRSADVRLTTTLHSETPGDNGYVPVPVATPDGALHVAWYDFRHDATSAEIFAKTRPPGGAWDLTPGDGADRRVTSDAANSELVAVAADSGGHLHAVWRSVDGGANVLYARRDAASGLWSVPIAVDSATAVQGAPSIAVDGDDAVHVVWPDGRGVEGGRALWTNVRSAGGAWSGDSRLTRPQHGADEPSLATAPDGSLHLVFSDGRASLFNREIFHRAKSAGADWDTTYASDARLSNAAGNSVRPSVLPEADRVFVVWKDIRDGNHELYFRLGAPGATDVPGGSPDPESSGVPGVDGSPDGLAGLEPGPGVRASPNPFRDSVRLAIPEGAFRPVSASLLSGSRAAPDVAEVFDLRGRRVRAVRVLSGSARWDGRDESGAPVPAGRYWIRAGAASGSVTVLR